MIRRREGSAPLLSRATRYFASRFLGLTCSALPFGEVAIKTQHLYCLWNKANRKFRRMTVVSKNTLRERLEEIFEAQDWSEYLTLLATVTRDFPNEIVLLDSAHPIQRYMRAFRFLNSSLSIRFVVTHRVTIAKCPPCDNHQLCYNSCR